MISAVLYFEAKIMKQYKGRESSVGNVRKLFSNTSGDTVSINKVFESFERAQKDEKLNRAWLSNLLSLIKSHNLVRAVYTTKHGPKTLTELELTLEGRRALGRSNGNGHPVESDAIQSKENGRSEQSIVSDFMEAHQRVKDYFEKRGLEIIFEIKPKEPKARR